MVLKFAVTVVLVAVAIAGAGYLAAVYERAVQVWLEYRALRSLADEQGLPAAIAKSDREIAHFERHLERAQKHWDTGFAGKTIGRVWRSLDHPDVFRGQIDIRVRARRKLLNLEP